MSDPVILTARGLTAGYRSGRSATPVLSGLNLDLRRGEMVSLLGSNGIGKSTLLRTLTGVQSPLAGTIEIDGSPLAGYTVRQLARTLGIVYTDRTLAGALTVEELVGLGRHPYTGFFGRLSSDDRRIVARAMERAGIAHKRGEHLARLSDGERQKTMIAKALAQQTPIIIMDEPTAFLDAASRIETMSLLHDLATDDNKAILLSTHDIAPAIDLSHRLWIVKADHTLVDGTPDELTARTDGLPSLFDGRGVTFDPAARDFKARRHNDG